MIKKTKFKNTEYEASDIIKENKLDLIICGGLV